MIINLISSVFRLFTPARGPAVLRWYCLRAALCLCISFPSLLIAQCTLSCNQGLQVSLNPAGQALITPQMIAPGAGSSCPGALEIKLTNNLGQTLPNPLTCNQIGINVFAQVKHSASGNTCTGTLTLADALPPAITCTSSFIWCFQTPDPEMTGLPAVQDNCTPAANLNLVFSDNATALPCGTLQNGVPVLRRIDRQWTATDEAGNTSSCQQKIWLKHVGLSNITFPLNRDGIQAPALNCGENPLDFTLTGEPTVDGLPIALTPLCEIGVTYSDQTINFCPPAGYTLLRTWTAVDFCAGAISNRIQIIKVSDTQAPQISLPAEIETGTTGFQCAGFVTLPNPTLTDNCSSVTATASWTFGNGFGPFLVPEGEHIATYAATDACGNQSTATLLVRVTDQTPPQAVCKSALQLSMGANGQALLQTSALDAGSFDNCSPIVLDLSRDGDQFSNTLLFSCADMGVDIPVTLRVRDAGGNENQCTGDVRVRDFLKPTIQCPVNLTLTCLQDPANLALTGQATATDNCGLASLTFTEQNNLDACHTGTLLRTWLAADSSGNTRSCTQTLTLQLLSTISVQFPANVTVNGCSGPGALAPAATGQPQVSGQSCFPVSVDYTDESFSAPPPFCRRILRSWKVSDQCLYNPNTGAGLWQQVQIIDIQDDTPPALSVPADVTVNADQPSCAALVALPAALATDCGSVVAVNHNSLYALQTGANASGVYPPGVHDITFTGTDGCGNSISKVMHVTVLDQSAPHAQCRSNLTLNLLAGGQAMLQAAMVNNGSWDDCGGALAFSVSDSMFQCTDIGQQIITLTVQDAAGNSSTCTTPVQVLDPYQVCGGGNGYTIRGGLRTVPGDTLARIPVALRNGALTVWVETDSSGQFTLEDVPADSSYQLAPYNNANWLNGVSTFDLLLISKHILGIQPLPNAWAMVAADANLSGSITNFDILQLRKLILGVYDSLPGAATSWRFIPLNTVFPQPDNPFAFGFPEAYVLDSLSADVSGLDFYGLKVGDVNNSTNAAGARDEAEQKTLRLPDALWMPGEVREIPLHLADAPAALGFQATLQVDTTLFALESVLTDSFYLIENQHIGFNGAGEIRLSWTSPDGHAVAEAPLLRLRLRARAQARPGEAIRLSNTRLAAEWYDADNRIGTLQLVFEQNTVAATQEGEKWRVFPNPCAEKVVFENPESDKAVLRIRDAQGRVVLHRTLTEKRTEISTAVLGAAGVYGYEIYCEFGKLYTGKLFFMP